MNVEPQPGKFYFQILTRGLKTLFFNFQALHPAIGNFIQTLHLEDIRVTHRTTGKLLIQIFLLHGINKVQGARILIQICHLHGIDLDTRALTLTSPHQGGNRGPNLLILISLYLEGLSLWERRQEFSGAIFFSWSDFCLLVLFWYQSSKPGEAAVDLGSIVHLVQRTT